MYPVKACRNDGGDGKAVFVINNWPSEAANQGYIYQIEAVSGIYNWSIAWKMLTRVCNKQLTDLRLQTKDIYIYQIEADRSSARHL